MAWGCLGFPRALPRLPQAPPGLLGPPRYPGRGLAPQATPALAPGLPRLLGQPGRRGPVPLAKNIIGFVAQHWKTLTTNAKLQHYESDKEWDDFIQCFHNVVLMFFHNAGNIGVEFALMFFFFIMFVHNVCS